MNILFFLKPKSEVAYVHDYGTLRQVLETMEYHKYASIPMLNKSGEYVGTITEGDLLWGIKRYTNLNLKEAENIFIQDFPRKVDSVPVQVIDMTKLNLVELTRKKVEKSLAEQLTE